MNSVSGQTFGKHCNVKDQADFYRLLSLPVEKQEIHVFDEEPGLVFLYISDGQSRYFARSVDTTNQEHYTSVMGAWASRREMIDCRTDKTKPLPCTTTKTGNGAAV